VSSLPAEDGPRGTTLGVAVGLMLMRVQSSLLTTLDFLPGTFAPRSNYSANSTNSPPATTPPGPTEPSAATVTPVGSICRCIPGSAVGCGSRWGRLWGGALKGLGRGGLDSTVLNDAVATQDTIRRSRSACFGEQTATGSGSSAYTSRTALLTKRRAVRSTNHLVTKRA
jgi:hypothetical protein